MEEGVGMAVGGNPGRQLLVAKRFGKGLVAGAQHGHKELGGADGPIGMVNRHGLPRPVHKLLFPGQ
jgi:hypothetical protein